MSIQERKIRKSGNSIILTLSKEFLEKLGIKENDMVYVDETKLAQAIQKKEKKTPQDLEVEKLMEESFLKYEETYRELANR